MQGRIKVSTSPYATVSAASIIKFISPYTTAISSSGWGFDSTSGNLVSPVIDGEILKIVANYSGGYTTSVWSLSTRDTPTELVANVTGTTTDETFYPRIMATDNTGSAMALATLFVPYAVHGSLLCSCSGVIGESLIVKIYYR